MLGPAGRDRLTPARRAHRDKLGLLARLAGQDPGSQPPPPDRTRGGSRRQLPWRNQPAAAHQSGGSRHQPPPTQVAAPDPSRRLPRRTTRRTPARTGGVAGCPAARKVPHPSSDGLSTMDLNAGTRDAEGGGLLAVAVAPRRRCRCRPSRVRRSRSRCGGAADVQTTRACLLSWPAEWLSLGRRSPGHSHAIGSGSPQLVKMHLAHSGRVGAPLQKFAAPPSP